MGLLRSLWFASLFAASFSAGCVVKEKPLCSGAFEPDNDACSLQFCQSEEHAENETCVEFLNRLRDAGLIADLDARVDGVDGADGADGSQSLPTDRDAAGNESDGATVAPSCRANDECGADKPLCLNDCSPCTKDEHCAWRKDAPVCDSKSGACVACTDDNLGACEAQGSVCEQGRNRCVACNDNSQCTAPGASVCSATHECVPCDETASASEAQCHLPGLPLCLAGTCVACQPGKLEACGGKVCDMVSGEAPVCSGKALHSAKVCEPCVSDEHCAVGQACVNMKWKNASVGWFCQWRKNTEAGSPIHACNSDDRPYTAQLTLSASADSDASVTVCTLAATTCEALRAYNGHCGRFGEGAAAIIVEDKTKLPPNTPPAEIHADSSVCGAGGICHPRNGALGSVDADGAYRCSFECSASDHTDCPNQNGVTCQGASIGGTGYCSVK